MVRETRNIVYDIKCERLIYESEFWEEYMNIVSLGGTYKPYQGGSAKRLSMMTELFEEQGNKVWILTRNMGDTQEFDSQYMKGHDIIIERFDTEKDEIHAVKALIEKGQVDVIIAHDIYTSVFCILKYKKFVPVFSEVHALVDYGSRLKRFIRNRLYAFIGHFSSGVFVYADAEKKYMIDHYGCKSKNIYTVVNGIQGNKDTSVIEINEKDNFVYTYAGTLYNWQGIGNLLNKCKEILSIGEDVLIRIVGGGEELENVIRFVEQEQLQERVIVTGFVDQKKYDAEIACSDVIVIPRVSNISTETTVPLKIFDAAEAGKPIIMSSVGGLMEVLGHNEALIYESDNLDDFVDKCKLIYRNYRLMGKLANNAKKRVAKWPTRRQVAEYQLEVMRNAIMKVSERE